jgi:hypothetical protein
MNEIDIDVSARQLAGFLGLTYERVRQLRGDGLLPEPARRGGKVSLRDSVKAYLDTLKRPDTTAAIVRQYKARLLLAQAERAEFQNERERGVWWLAAQAERETGLVWQETAQWLDTLPGYVEREVELPAAALDTLQRAIDTHRLVLATNIQNLKTTIEKASI